MKMIPQPIAIIFCLVASIILAFLVSLFSAPRLAALLFPDAGLGIILIVQFVFLGLLAFLSTLFFVLIFKISIFGILTRQREKTSEQIDGPSIRGLVGLILGGLVGVSSGIFISFLLLGIPIFLLGLISIQINADVLTMAYISYPIVILLCMFLGWKMGKIGQHGKLVKLITQFFRFNIPLLITGILFLAILILGIIYKSDGIVLLLVPLALIVFSFVSKIFKLKLAGLVVGIVLLFLGFAATDTFSSLCEVYVCVSEVLMYLTPRVLLVGATIGVYESLPRLKLDAGKFPPWFEIVLRIIVVLFITLLLLSTYHMLSLPVFFQSLVTSL